MCEDCEVVTGLTHQQIKIRRLSQTLLVQDCLFQVNHRDVQAIEVDVIEVELTGELVVDVRHVFVVPKSVLLELFMFFYFWRQNLSENENFNDTLSSLFHDLMVAHEAFLNILVIGVFCLRQYLLSIASFHGLNS